MIDFTIPLEAEEFDAIFSNAKRFTRQPKYAEFWRGAQVIFTCDRRSMHRIISHVQPADVLLKGDAKEVFLSVRPATKEEKETYRAQSQV